ncbi:hypothetical protein ACLX1H_010310 [Fusarium chlamydosporum]
MSRISIYLSLQTLAAHVVLSSVLAITIIMTTLGLAQTTQHSVGVPCRDMEAGVSQPLPLPIDSSTLNTSSRIFHIIERYRMRPDRVISKVADESTLKFIALIYTQVKTGNPVPLCLPAFPFKSPNATSKTLGKLPDKGEEIALAHLNGLCCVPDKDVWAYGETLRSMAADMGLTNISFARLRDLVDMDLPKELEEMTYVANASNFRCALLNNFSKPGWSWDHALQGEDQCMTYRGYIKFLQTDLQTVYPIDKYRTKSKYKRGIEYIAKQMMTRGVAFAHAVRQRYPEHIRLSTHPSTGATKLSISLLPTEQLYTTPWHCSVAVMLDGTIKTGMRSDFDIDQSLELIYENGRPSYFREKSPLLSWADDKGGIIISPMYPTGLIIRPVNGPGSLAVDDIDVKRVRSLAEINSPIVLKGFVKKPNRERLIELSYRFGTPLPWKFGLLLEVKDQGQESQGLNNVLSSEPMPMHYDGLFKMTKQADEDGREKIVSSPPRY